MSLRYDETWISEPQLDQLCSLAASTNSLAGECVEIGVHQGRSAIRLAAAVAPTVLHAVDDWSARDLPPDARARDNHSIWCLNLRESGTTNIKEWRMPWRTWAGIWRYPLRFAHIDAHHTATEVFDQISALRPLLVRGGVICGDDWLQPPVRKGVLWQFPSVDVYENLWWARCVI